MSGWLSSLPSGWSAANPRHHFKERRESSLPADVHLTPSQHHGVLSQADYMAKTGSKVVLNLSAPDNMKHVEPDDFIAHLRSFQGGLEKSDRPGKVSTAYTVIKPLQSAEPRFYKWVLKSPGYIQVLASSLEQLRDGQSIKFGDFAAIDLPMPPIEEQRRIASFLDDRVARIDQIINARRRQLGLISDLTRESFGETINAASDGVVQVKRLLSSPPDYGLLPDETSNDRSLPRYIRTTDIDDHGQLRPDTFLSVDTRWLSDYRVSRGDVLIARSGTIGRAMVVSEESEAVFAGYLVRLRFAAIDPWSFWFVTKTGSFADQLALNAVQSTILNFNADRYASMWVPDFRGRESVMLCELRRRQAASANHEAALTRAVNLLQEYRQSLITAAVTGDLDVTTAGNWVPG